jgi:hypothetical protein
LFSVVARRFFDRGVAFKFDQPQGDDMGAGQLCWVVGVPGVLLEVGDVLSQFLQLAAGDRKRLGTQAASSLLASDGQARIVTNVFMSIAPLGLGWNQVRGKVVMRDTSGGGSSRSFDRSNRKSNEAK